MLATHPARSSISCKVLASVSGDPHHYRLRKDEHSCARLLPAPRRHRCARARPASRLRHGDDRGTPSFATSPTATARNVDPATDPKDCGRADLVGHLGSRQNEGPAFQELIAKFNEDVPERQDQLPVGPVRRGAEQVQDRGRGRAPALRTSCAPRSPGSPSSPRSATSTPWTAPTLLERQVDFLATPLSSNVTTARRTAFRRSPTRSRLLYNKKIFDRRPASPRPPRPGPRSRTAAQAHQGQDRRGRPVHQLRRLLPAAVHLRRGRRPGRRGRQEDHRQLAPRTSAGIKIAQDLVEQRRRGRSRPANDSYGTMMTLFKEQQGRA